MRAVLTNFGSTGDIEPFFALGVEMQRHGHQPVLAMSPYYATRAEQLGLEFVPIGPDLQKVQSDINMLTTMPSTVGQAQLPMLWMQVAAALPRMFKELREACRDADVLISGTTQPASQMIHELTGIPFVAVYVIYVGSEGAYELPAQQASTAFINSFRQQIGLPPLANAAITAGTAAHDGISAQLNLYAVSRHVVPPPDDWPSHYHMTGYFFLDQSWQPDPALVEFLDAGDPPVVIGFGSMTHDDPNALTDLFLEAIDLAKCRAIIQHGWSGVGNRSLPPHIHGIGFVPHRWLFPRAACVVHHGATGTTGATYRAGVPAVFVPHAYEHPFNAQTAHKLGIAVPPIPYAELSAQRLGEAIAMTLNDPSYSRCAAAIGEKVRAEQGVQMARQLIESLIDV